MKKPPHALDGLRPYRSKVKAVNTTAVAPEAVSNVK